MVVSLSMKLQNNSKATKGVESATREAFDADRVKYEEEIASLRRLIDGVYTVHVNVFILPLYDSL